VLYEYDLAGKELAVSSLSGAISPESWGGPGGAYVAGYLPPPSETPVDIFLAPVGDAPVRADGKVGRPLQISGGGPGCRLAYPVFVPGSGELVAVQDCGVHVGDGVGWATSTELVSVDPRTGHVEGAVAELPPGLDIDRVAFDTTGAWMAFSAAAANPQGTDEGVFICHDGRFWQVPGSATLEDPIWK
jgi:hypothetical protein